ncbi:ABC transporter permease [Enterococcus sp. AZ109]|uniref:ABC transporter permease n=1 Tax=Enterococcus sp. AZ109 TaxID=2774634 RepID=UPI003F27EC9F
MKMINSVAWANTKYHRSKNLLSGIAIILTTLLVFLILTMGLGVVHTQNAAVNEVFPTFHAMFRGFSEEKKDQLAQHAALETYGLRQDVGRSTLGDTQVVMLYMDQNALDLNKVVMDGRAPEKENEAALSTSTLKAYGYEGAKIGDSVLLPFQPYTKDGTGIEEQQTFTISGLIEETGTSNNAKQKVYSMMVSKSFMETYIPVDQRDYRVLLRLTPEEARTTDGIEAATKEIGKSFDVLESDIVTNDDYLFANYTDPAFYSGMAIIVVIISVAGALTIYSIYYVSLISKVQEFGKLKALGATKKQVRQIVLKENLLVAAIAIPVGLVIGSAGVLLFFEKLVEAFDLGGDILTTTMRQVLSNGEVQLIVPWIVALSIGISLLTVIIASLRPMRLASKIMPIEAIRYTGQNETKRKKRKGFIDLNLERLTGANLSRNKKRTIITIVSLGLIGILFVTVSTVFNCMDPQDIARQEMAEDFRLELDTWGGDQMAPERDWNNLQQNNPLTPETLQQIAAIPGVEEVDPHITIHGEIPEFKELNAGKSLNVSIGGITQDQMDEVHANLDKGDVTYEDLAGKDTLIACGFISHNYPELEIGETVDVTIFDGNESFVKKMTIVAAGDFPKSLDNYNTLLASEETIKGFSNNNLTSHVDIKADQDQLSEVKQQLEAIKAESEFYELDSFEDRLEIWESGTLIMRGAGYAILLVLAIVGIMNLVNTTIDSILSRKKELGIMQAIGMSNSQMKKMLRLEGMFYAGGIVLLAAGLGSIIGYLVFLYVEAEGIMQIRTYSYPFLQVILLIVVVVFVQLILTAATIHLVNKETVITRIQASE